MTLKSIIKFGAFPDLSVNDFLRLKKYKELLKMYYMLEKIDFNQKIKDILCITKTLEIPKPGKHYKTYYDNVFYMICDINKKLNQTEFDMFKNANHNKKHEKIIFKINEGKGYNKTLNKERNRKTI